eukprot:snap_masked-scaffold_1-processed-gene-29.33-mRNA-1 protein AED:1.00 eAED:1.00 QI:0/0/0/0/1/1/6/0/158
MFPVEREVSSFFFKPLGSRNRSSASCCRTSFVIPSGPVFSPSLQVLLKSEEICWYLQFLLQEYPVHELKIFLEYFYSFFIVFSIFHGNGALRFPLFSYYPFHLFESFMDIILCHSCIYSSYLKVQPGFVVIQDSFSVRDFHSLLLISNKVSVLSEDVL